jgi:RNA polymerase sigma-70 factor, ECF subfamily
MERLPMQMTSQILESVPPDAARRARLHLVLLMQLAAAGDQTAFAELHAATVRKLRSKVMEVLGSNADVDDVLQDVYLRIWTRGHQFDPRISSPMTWMLVVARNVAIDRLRRRRQIAEPIEQEALSIAEPPIDPFEHQDRAIKVQIALAALRKLAPERAELLSRAFIEGQSRAALARTYGAPASTIKTWIRRSLAEVRRRLETEAAGHSNLDNAPFEEAAA